MSAFRKPWLASRQTIFYFARPKTQACTVRQAIRYKQSARYQSTKPSTGPTPNPSSSTVESAAERAATEARVKRATRWAPRFLTKYMSTLYGAPITTLVSFLILHELTAIVPLFGLAGAFHYYNWLPPFFSEGVWVLKGVSLFSNWFRKRGWISDADAKAAQEAAEQGQADKVEKKSAGIGQTVGKWFGRGEVGTRWVVEFATAYAVVKALLPFRLVVSVSGAPAFARWTVIPFTRWVKGRFGRKKVITAANGVKEAGKK